MANTKGVRLMSGESWSDKFPGYIDKGNSLFRSSHRKGYFLLMKCYVCGADALKDKSNLRKSDRAFCSKKCRYSLMEKPNGSKKFKRGKSLGHVMIKQKNHPFANLMGDVAEHRLIIEKHIGRYLLPSEYVHHINLIKDDNRLENLVLFDSHSGHFKAHGSLNRCVSTLVDRNIIKYNRDLDVYEVV
jgi:hypothetical protein